MTPEISRGLAKIADSPFWKLGGERSAKLMSEWVADHHGKKDLSEEAKEALKQAEASYKEPWRWVKTYGFDVLPVFAIPPEDRYIVGEVPGGVTLVAVGEGATNRDEVYVAPMTDIDSIYLPVTIDSYAAQSQAPIKWKKRPNG